MASSSNPVLLVGLGIAAIIGIAWAMQQASPASAKDGGGSSGGSSDAGFSGSGAPSLTGAPALTGGPGAQSASAPAGSDFAAQVAAAQLGAPSPYTSPSIGSTYATPQINSLAQSLANATYDLANQLNAGIGAEVYQPTATSIKINPALPAASLPAAQKALDKAVIGSGLASVGAPQSLASGGVGFGIVAGVQQLTQPTPSNVASLSSSQTLQLANQGFLTTAAAQKAGALSYSNVGGVQVPVVSTPASSPAPANYSPAQAKSSSSSSAVSTAAKLVSSVAPSQTSPAKMPSASRPAINLTTGAAYYTPAPKKK